jgi:aminoglycoside 6-adenylyltransferase
MLEQQISGEIADVFKRGFKILVDKDRLAERLTDSARWPEKVEKLPTTSLWNETGHDFLYHVLLAAKKARRGELWVATSSCNGYLQNLRHWLTGARRHPFLSGLFSGCRERLVD